MSNSIQSQREDIDTWTQQWEDALKSGLFDDVSKPAAVNPQTADMSFFGPVNSNPSAGKFSDCDAEYWDNLHRLANDGVASGNEVEALLHEEEKPEVNTDQIVFKAANPVRRTSLGKDQDIDPEQMDVTFDADDINDLAKLKTDLQMLEDKMNDKEGRGESAKGIDKQLAALRKRIDDLSDRMTTKPRVAAKK